MNWIKALLIGLIMPPVLFGMTSTALADWDGFGEFYTDFFDGVVMSVTRDGYMLVSPSAGAEDDIIYVRPWQLKVHYTVLTLFTLGRPVYCAEIYRAEGIVAAECALKFFRNDEDHPLHTGLPSSRAAGGGLLRAIIGPEFGAIWECSEEDIRFEQSVPDMDPRYSCGEQHVEESQ